jgi:triacylglycerol lipase
MKSAIAFMLCLLAATVAFAAESRTKDETAGKGTVVLLHGLARSASSMHDMEQALMRAGYRVCNVAYPSRSHSIADLTSQFVAPAIARCAPDATRPVNFVAHSLGGIIVRELAKAGVPWNFGRVVMLGPPNQGSEVVDSLGSWQLFRFINGPAGKELGTSRNSTPRQLGPATFQVGIVAGTHSINWINSLIIPGVDDGKVSIERAKLDGMQDFIRIGASHPFLMKDREAIKQTIRFLDSGCFAHGKTTRDSDQACTEGEFAARHRGSAHNLNQTLAGRRTWVTHPTP